MVSRSLSVACLLVACTGCGGDGGDSDQDASVDANSSVDADSSIDSGPGAPAVFWISAASDFGPVSATTASPTQRLTIASSGGNSGTIAVAISGTNAGDFAIGNNTCTTLDGNATCTLDVTFTPGATPGDKTAILSVTGAASGNAMTALAGTSIPADALTITPSSFDFGAVEAGKFAEHAFTLSNTKATSASVTSVTAGGAPYFIVASNCTTVAAGANCQMTVRYAPTAVSINPTTLVVSTGSGSPTASLTGHGASLASLGIVPSSIDFGSVLLGNTSTPITFTLKNLGESASGTITTLSTSSQSYVVSADTCAGRSLGMNQTCTFDVTFAPKQAGSISGTVSQTVAPGGTPSANLNGIGLANGAVSISPSHFTFADTAAGATSEAQSFTLQNTSSSSSAGLSITTTNGFALQAGGTCTSSLAAGQTCTVSVEFAPASSGTVTGTLSSGTGSTAALAGRAP